MAQALDAGDGRAVEFFPADQGRRVGAAIGRTRQIEGVLGTIRTRFNRGASVAVIGGLSMRLRFVMAAGEKAEGRKRGETAVTGRRKPDDQSQEPNPLRPTHSG